MRKRIIKFNGTVDDVLLKVSAVFLLLTTVLAVANTVVRFMRLGNITWVEEVNTILMIMLVFIAQPALEFNDKQLCINILQSALKSEFAKRVFIIIRGIITIALTSYILYYIYKVMGNAIKFNYVTSVLMFPRKYMFACMLISYGLVVLSWITGIFCRRGAFAEVTDIGVIDESIIDSQVEDFMLGQKDDGSPDALNEEEEGD